MKTKIWSCKIGEVSDVPSGGDSPMRRAVYSAYVTLTGREPVFCFSGWGAELTEPERACVENRDPQPASDLDSLRRELEAVRGERDRMKALLDDAQACGLIHHTACAVAFGKTCDCGVGELDHQIQDALTPAPKETE